MLVDLQAQRKAALQRCQSSIEEMEAVLNEMKPDAPKRRLVKALLRRLRANSAALAAGIENVKARVS